jgi:hypothetical protein
MKTSGKIFRVAHCRSQVIGLPGERWDFSCEFDTFKVQSSCSVPNLPKLLGNSLRFTNNLVTFSIEYDSSAYVYDFYLYDGNTLVFERIEPICNQPLPVVLDIPSEMNIEQMELYAYAYDKNFAEYFSTSATFFKPNAYRPPFTTVLGGFGVFGAVSGARLWPAD